MLIKSHSLGNIASLAPILKAAWNGLRHLKSTYCPDCRLRFCPELKEDVALHQVRQANWEALALPIHCSSLLPELDSGATESFLVGQALPIWKHEHMRRCAEAFNQEMGFNSVPWPDPHTEQLANAVNVI